MIDRKHVVFFLLFWAAAAAGQNATPFILTEFPLSAVSADSGVWVKWTGAVRPDPSLNAPDSAVLYFDVAPGGSNIENYRYRVEKFCTDTLGDGSIVVESNRLFGGMPPMRGKRFRPGDQPGMGAGVFYFMVAFRTRILDKDTTFYSNEMQMVVESNKPVATIAPIGDISKLTPVFSWETNPGVPYYHVILSDEPISFDSTVETVNGKRVVNRTVKGLSIVWQAITPKTQIVYGAPDPSGTITASAPPLSPGHTYTWIVLNNYGNQIAYSSMKYGLPKSFTILGTPLAKPVLVGPKNAALSAQTDSIVTFRWTNLDSAANTYKVYVYMNYTGASSQQSISGNARLSVWENEVTAAGFAGPDGVLDSHDTGVVTINAKNTLTDNNYVWRVFAIDKNGASTASDSAGFTYRVPASGTMKIYTREKIQVGAGSGGAGADTVNVAAVELQCEVVSGSLEAPLLFYTDLDGVLSRTRPVGTYRITAVKNGFNALTKTLTLDSGKTLIDTFYLQRPASTMYGKVMGEDSIGIGAASVIAVSELSDTARAQTDALGSFVVNCYEADWRLHAEKTGFVASLPVVLTVGAGRQKSLSPIVLLSNPFTVSGIVKNNAGVPLLGVDVRLIRDGRTADEAPSTPQDGTFSFAAKAGTYTLYATKTGFATFSRVIQVSGSMQVNVAMPAGASLITGFVYGRTWIKGKWAVAPVTKAVVKFVDTAKTSSDTFMTVSDATYGDFRISVTGGKTYAMLSSATGFFSHARVMPEAVKAGATVSFDDTVTGLGSVRGAVKLSATRLPVASATITLIDKITGQVVSAVQSRQDGGFEARNLADRPLIVRAGAKGLVTDSIIVSDSLFIFGGKTAIGDGLGPDSLLIYMSPGTKSICWFVNGGVDTTAIIKVRSPVEKNLSARDTLRNAGSQQYIIAAHATDSSAIDLAFHAFFVAQSDTVHCDSISLHVYNRTPAAVRVVRDSVRLLLQSPDTLDSAVVLYRDIDAAGFDSARLRAPAVDFTFAITPPANASVLAYYFRAYRGNNMYGYGQQTFTAAVVPDTTKLTKLELIPGAADTILFPANAEIRCAVKGYYGAAFAAASLRDSAAVTWRLIGGRGDTLLAARGISTTLRTGAAASAAPVLLRAIVDTSVIHVDPRVVRTNELSLYFRTSGRALAALRVRRTDAQGSGPITTSRLSKAEFSAEGLDDRSQALFITPAWSVSPPQAGTITGEGVFTPARKFAGVVRVRAASGSLTSEYVAEGQDSARPGLAVYHLVVQSATPDTFTNFSGCTVVLPDSVVSGSTSQLVRISVPVIKNEIARTTGRLTAVGNVFDIEKLSTVPFLLGPTDSIMLLLGIPQGAGGSLSVGTWNDTSLVWTSLADSRVLPDNTTVAAAITHFSRYAVLSSSDQLKTVFYVLPNPFSPLRSPSEFPLLAAKFGTNAPRGTCIAFMPDIPDQRLRKIRVRIYNIVGDCVCSVVHQDVPRMVMYRFWWNGRTSDRDVPWGQLESGGDDNIKVFPVAGGKMCRNGRYFVVLTLEDSQGKEKNFMQQVVLVK